jgi:hypothetical protein
MSIASIVDYTDAFPYAIAAQGLGKNVLILEKLEHPFRRIDRKEASYQIEYRWLSTLCSTEKDQAWCCVLGSEFSYFQRKEFDIEAIKSGRKTLFDCFQLFG